MPKGQLDLFSQSGIDADPVMTGNVNPAAYLADTLARIAAGHPINRIDRLIPWTYKHPDAAASP